MLFESLREVQLKGKQLVKCGFKIVEHHSRLKYVIISNTSEGYHVLNGSVILSINNTPTNKFTSPSSSPSNPNEKSRSKLIEYLTYVPKNTSISLKVLSFPIRDLEVYTFVTRISTKLLSQTDDSSSPLSPNSDDRLSNFPFGSDASSWMYPCILKMRYNISYLHCPHPYKSDAKLIIPIHLSIYTSIAIIPCPNLTTASFNLGIEISWVTPNESLDDISMLFGSSNSYELSSIERMQQFDKSKVIITCSDYPSFMSTLETLVHSCKIIGFLPLHLDHLVKYGDHMSYFMNQSPINANTNANVTVNANTNTTANTNTNTNVIFNAKTNTNANTNGMRDRSFVSSQRLKSPISGKSCISIMPNHRI